MYDVSGVDALRNRILSVCLLRAVPALWEGAIHVLGAPAFIPPPPSDPRCGRANRRGGASAADPATRQPATRNPARRAAMTPSRRLAALSAVAAGAVALSSPAAALDTVRVGWRRSVTTNGVAPFAVATHCGWFEDLGLQVEAIRIVRQTYPQTVPSGVPEQEALDRGEAMPATVAEKWTLNGETDNWGEIDVATCQSYLDWLLQAGVPDGPVSTEDVTSNALIGAINEGLYLGPVQTALGR
jgi:hypothetical protein